MPLFIYIECRDLNTVETDAPTEVSFAHCFIEAPNKELALEQGRAKLCEEQDESDHYSGFFLGEECVEI